MPKGKKNTKKGKSKSSGKGGMGGKGGGHKRAPAAVSSFAKQYVSFYGTGETLGLRGKIALFDVSTSGTVGNTSGLIGATAGTGIIAARLSPTAALTTTNAPAYTVNGFVSPALDLLASAFTRYKAKKSVFHYLPLFTTNSTQQLIFGFAADPCHPQLSSTTATLPTFVGIEALSDSRPFAPWDEWRMDVSERLPKEWLYTSSNSVGDGAAGSDTSRFDNWGSVGCVVSTPSTATAERYGVLYLEFDIELKEFCPISVSRPTLLLALQEKISHHLKKYQARTGQGEISVDSHASLDLECAAVNLCSSSPPPSSKPRYKELDLDGFLLHFQARRREGESPGQIVTDLSESFILDARCIKLIFESGLLDYLSHPGCRHETESTEGGSKDEEVVPQMSLMTLADVKKPSVSNFKIGLE